MAADLHLSKKGAWPRRTSCHVGLEEGPKVSCSAMRIAEIVGLPSPRPHQDSEAPSKPASQQDRAHNPFQGQALQETKELGLRSDDGDTPQRPHTHRSQSSVGRTAVGRTPGLLTNRCLTTGLKGKHGPRQHAHYQAHNRGQDEEGETEEPRNEK